MQHVQLVKTCDLQALYSCKRWHNQLAAKEQENCDSRAYMCACVWEPDFRRLLDDSRKNLIAAGQGLSLAVEDAVVLAWYLKQQGLCPSALRR